MVTREVQRAVSRQIYACEITVNRLQNLHDNTHTQAVFCLTHFRCLDIPGLDGVEGMGNSLGWMEDGALHGPGC